MKNWTSRTQIGVLTALFATAIVGCGSNDPDLVTVEGTVTMGGAPLPEAEVTFQPETGDRPSTATTDFAGRYKLLYTMDKDGALPGRHKVVISTYVEPDSDYEAPDRRAGRPELVPKQYNYETTLAADVRVGQRDPIDFTLNSDGEIYSAEESEEEIEQ